MPEQVPPSPEVAKEILDRLARSLESAMRPLREAMNTAGRSIRLFMQAYDEAEMKYQADAMRDDPREVDNRLVDWLRTPD